MSLCVDETQTNQIEAQGQHDEKKTMRPRQTRNESLLFFTIPRLKNIEEENDRRKRRKRKAKNRRGGGGRRREETRSYGIKMKRREERR